MRIGGRDRKHSAAQNFAITDAPKPLSQDIRSREQKYLMAMGIRVVAFILIVVLPIHWGWKIGLIALALILPYVAVVYANGGRERTTDVFDMYQDPARRVLTAGEDEPDDAKPDEPLSGTVLDDPAPEPSEDQHHAPER